MSEEKTIVPEEAENEVKTLTEDNGGVTEGTLQQWKNLHGKVQVVQVEDPEEGVILTGYFKRPDMRTMEAVSAVSRKNEVQGGTVLFDNCWLGGNELLKKDAVYKMEAIAALSGLFGKCTHSLKNL